MPLGRSPLGTTPLGFRSSGSSGNIAQGVSGSLALTGNASITTAPSTAQGVVGTLAVTGKISTAKIDNYAQGVVGSLSLTGKTATAKIDNFAQGVVGSLALTGNAATASHGVTVLGVTGHISLFPQYSKTDDGDTPPPKIKHGPLDLTDDLLVDITPVTSDYATTSIPLSYTITNNQGVGIFGLNVGPLNSYPLDQPGANFPLPYVVGTLNTKYIQGAFLEGSLTLKHQLMDDAEYALGELNHKYSQGTPEPVVRSSELNMKWELDAYDLPYYVNELNIRQAHTGVDYYMECLSEINTLRAAAGAPELLRYSNVENVEGTDIAWGLSHQMAKHDIFASESTSFDDGYKTLEDVRQRIPEGMHKIGVVVVGWPMVTFMDPTELVAWIATQSDLLPYLLDDYLEIEGNGPALAVAEHFWIGLDYNWKSDTLDSLTGNPVGTEYVFITFIFGGLSTVGADGMQELALNHKYQLDAYDVCSLNMHHELDAYTPVVAQHSALWGVNVSQQNSTLWGAKVAAQHEAPIHYTVTFQHDAPYVGTVSLVEQHNAPYSLVQYVQVAEQNDAGYGIRICSQHIANFAILQNVVEQNEAGYTAIDQLAVQNETKYDLLTYNPVQTQHSAFWTMIDGTVTTSTSTATVTVNSVTIEVLEAVIAVAEGDIAWNANIRILDLSQYKNINKGDALTLNILGENFTLEVESKSLNRNSPAGASMQINALSPTIDYRSPAADLIDIENTMAILASEMVEDILDGATIDWQIVDWFIPAYRVMAEEAVPADLARNIVEAAGGVLEAKKDGTFLARKRFPNTIPAYSTATPDQVYTDIEDNLSVSEDHDPREDYNKFQIMEGKANFQDTIEWVPDESTPVSNGILRAYPSPWRTNVQIIHTDGVVVGLTLIGTVQRQEEELVEFTEGVGSLQYPGITIDSIVWHSDVLSGITLEPFSTVVTTGTTVNYGYGLATITYTTQAIEYSTNAPLGSNVQYLLEDLG